MVRAQVPWSVNLSRAAAATVGRPPPSEDSILNLIEHAGAYRSREAHTMRPYTPRGR
jgi:hypothetical protein